MAAGHLAFSGGELGYGGLHVTLMTGSYNNVKYVLPGGMQRNLMFANVVFYNKGKE